MSEFTVEIAKELVKSNTGFPITLQQACEWLNITDYYLALKDVQGSFTKDKDYIIVGKYVDNVPVHERQLSLECFKRWCITLDHIKYYNSVWILDCLRQAEQQSNLTPNSEWDAFKELVVKVSTCLNDIEQRLSKLEEKVSDHWDNPIY